MQRLADTASGLLALARRRMRGQRTRRVLERLSGRTLKDIGIHRSEISLFTASDRDRRRHRNAAWPAVSTTTINTETIRCTTD
jgi:uncharacterized protein YjiS (DUF1127 family)